MAFDKVVDSTVLDTKLTAIADAIRGKTGGTEGMTLDAMVSAIEGIEAGGGLPDGIPYTSGSFTLASTSANVIITHNFNSDKVFVMWAIKDNPAIMQVDRKALMGFLVSTNVYPERTVDISAYNNDGKEPTYEAGRNESWSYNALSIRTSGPGWRESATDSTRRVNYDSNIIELYGTFEKGHVYEWIAVDISSIIPWAEEATE